MRFLRLFFFCKHILPRHHCDSLLKRGESACHETLCLVSLGLTVDEIDVSYLMASVCLAIMRQAHSPLFNKLSQWCLGKICLQKKTVAKIAHASATVLLQVVALWCIRKAMAWPCPLSSASAVRRHQGDRMEVSHKVPLEKRLNYGIPAIPIIGPVL